MHYNTVRFRLGTVLVASVFAVSLANADDAMRQQVMRLNDVTGQEAINAKIVELLKDKSQSKKLLAEAMAANKDQAESPFNYNGAYILARLAQFSKDYDASSTFYKVCVDQAIKIKSGQKLVQVYDGLIALYLDNKKYDDAVAACQSFIELRAGKDVEKLKPFVMEKMVQALSRGGKADEAMKTTDRLLELFNGNWYFVRLKAEVLAQGGKITEAVNAYEEALDKVKEIKGDDDEATEKSRKEANDAIRQGMEEFIINLLKQQKTDEALKLTDELTKTDWYFARLKAEVLREAGRPDDAIVAFEEAIQKINKAKADDKLKKRIVERCRYVLSGVYTDKNQIDKAADQLKTLMQENPESATYHNDLGYVWADHDMNLDEAEKLIRKALELDKAEREKLKKEAPGEIEDRDNPAYLDSLGWVLFKKKDYAGAKKYLSEACKADDGQHVEIYDHLADVLMALGEKDQAIATWKKALTLENVVKRDEQRKQAVRKKLEQAEMK